VRYKIIYRVWYTSEGVFREGWCPYDSLDELVVGIEHCCPADASIICNYLNERYEPEDELVQRFRRWFTCQRLFGLPILGVQDTPVWIHGTEGADP
jgi:hypothetical protein